MPEAAGLDRVVREIVDRAEIYDLMSRYAFMMDTGALAEIVDELFTEDIVEDHGDAFGGALEGRDAVRHTFVAGAEALEATQHFIGNHHIELDGDTARGYFYVQGWHWLRSTSGGGTDRPADFLNVAAYVNEFRRTPDGWRISRQSAHMFGPGSTGLAAGELPEQWRGGFAAEERLRRTYAGRPWVRPYGGVLHTPTTTS